MSDVFIESHYRGGRRLLNEHGLALCAEAGMPLAIEDSVIARVALGETAWGPGVVGPTPDGRAAQVIEPKVHLGLEIHLDFPRVKILFRGPRAGRRPELGDQDRFFRKKAFDAARQLFRAKQGL